MPAASRTSPVFRLGAATVVLAVVAIALAGLGSRWGWWTFRTGFSILRWGSYAALAGAALALVGALVPGRGRRRPLVRAALLTAVALATVAVPWQARRTAQRVPPIHDITTDTEQPPAFVALRDRRPGATNPVEYGGPEVAAQQRAGYPDLAPLTLAVPPREALARAERVARALGWAIVAVDTSAGRLEATDRTRWFGFSDDVVVRVTPSDAGSRVDVRSLSRVGGSDVGANAARIRRFVERMREAR
ncbi:MAG: DUF1499 domain-containing protein [Gemmatirosa sp.]